MPGFKPFIPFYASLMSLLIFPLLVVAEVGYIRRVAVFPPQVPQNHKTTAEKTWWEVRERLTEDKRFLVASRDFLQQKRILQPRGRLKPADAVILARLLDAHAIVTMALEERTFEFRVYSGRDGQLFWSNDLEFGFARPVSEQMVAVATRQVDEFVRAIPYEGVVVADLLLGGATFKEDGRTLTKVQMPHKVPYQKGERVYWLRIQRQNLKALFGDDGAKLEFLAEGRVVDVKDGHLIAEVERAADFEAIQPGTLVQVGQPQTKPFRDNNPEVQLAMLSPEQLQKSDSEQKSIPTLIAVLANLAAVLLLAF